MKVFISSYVCFVRGFALLAPSSHTTQGTPRGLEPFKASVTNRFQPSLPRSHPQGGGGVEIFINFQLSKQHQLGSVFPTLVFIVSFLARDAQPESGADSFVFFISSLCWVPFPTLEPERKCWEKCENQAVCVNYSVFRGRQDPRPRLAVADVKCESIWLKYERKSN